MDVPYPQDQDATVAALQELLKQREKDVEELRHQLKQEQFANEFRKLLISSSAMGLVLAPFSRSHLLEMIVQIATRFIDARSSSLFLIDEATHELVFEVAIGPAAKEVKKFRVPLGHGIAGLVALTGQPMAITQASKDTRLATDIAFAVNYVPDSILCTPLFYNDRVIGVLELLDKQVGASFTPQDMDMSGQFANIAAVAIAQSGAFMDQQAFFQAMIRSFGEADVERRQQLYHEATQFTNWAETTDMLSTKARELALYVHELILEGEQSCDLCINMLQGFVFRARENKKLQASLTDFSSLSPLSRR